MRFIRNGRIRERIVDAVAKGILIAFSALVCLWMISGARAASLDIVDIRFEEVAGGDQAVDLIFSGVIASEDVAVDYQRNFIQVSVKGASAYPARTKKFNHALLEKAFTYQYQPDLARARLLLKSPAKDVRARTNWSVEAKKVRILIKGGAISAQREDAVKSVSSSAVDSTEADARKEILQGTLGAGSSTAAVPAKTADPETLPVFSSTAGPAPTGAQAKPQTTTSKMLASLLLVLGVIGAGAMGFKRFVLGKGLSLQRQGKMIEVIATQTLGPKRSIAVVKVLDQHMVVGMSGDGMTLLTNLGANVNIDRFMEEPGAGASFSDTLQGAITAPVAQKAPAGASSAGREISFRASIKKRLEGFKPL